MLFKPKKFFISLFKLSLALLFSFQAFSQADIRGALIGSDDKEPLMFATVSIFNSETKAYIKGVQTDLEGNFTLSAIPAGNYYLKASFVGFEEFQKQNITVENGKDLNLGSLTLKTSGKILEEVVVAGAKPAMELQMDRKVFNVAQSAISVGGTATDLLANVPSLQVDMDGSVSLRGSSSVRILINGRESAMAGNDITRLLQALPANAIERVEVITNPSAKYDAEGQSGIINIVLKKDAKFGLNGAVNAFAGSWWNAGAGFNLNYRQGKVNYYGNYNFSRRNNLGDSWNNTDFFSGSRTENTSESRRLGLNHGVGLGLDYYISGKSLLGVAANVSVRGNDRQEDIYYKYFNNPELTGNSTRLSRQNEDDLGYDVNINFKQDFNKKGEELTANFSYGKDTEDGLNTFNQFYTASKEIIENRRNETSETGKNINVQLDYALPLSLTSKFGTGYRTIIRTSDETQHSQLMNLETGQMVPDYDISNDFDMESIVHALYANYENQITKDFGLQFGLRAEQAYLNTEYFSYNPEVPLNERSAKGRLDYFRIYPSVFLTRKLANENQLQVSYTRRVNRPRGWQVNPFINVSDPMNIRQGNPNLLPEDIHSFELSHAKFWEKITLTSSAYYRRMNDVVQPVVTSVEGSSGATFSQFQNISRNETTGFEFISQLNLSKKVDVTANANFFYRKFQGSQEFNIAPTDGFNWNANAITNYRISPVLSAQVRMEYRAPQVMAQGKSVEAFIVDAGLKLDVLKKKGSVNFNLRDLFNQRRWGGYTETFQFYRESESRWMRRNFMVAFTYRIGGMSDKKKDNNGQGGGEFEGEGSF